VGLGVGKRATLPTVPMIFAARMGPTPKISVRVVPEASTSASVRRPPRSVPCLAYGRRRRGQQALETGSTARRRPSQKAALVPKELCSIDEGSRFRWNASRRSISGPGCVRTRAPAPSYSGPALPKSHPSS
jgi:hypothetical protein